MKLNHNIDLSDPSQNSNNPSPYAYGGGAVLYDISIFEFRKIVTYSANYK